MNFGLALDFCKKGYRIARSGWNGKKQYVELATNVSYVRPDGEVVNVNHSDMGNKALAFIGTSGVQLGWLASQSDMLSEDWKLVLNDVETDIEDFALIDLVSRFKGIDASNYTLQYSGAKTDSLRLLLWFIRDYLPANDIDTMGNKTGKKSIIALNNIVEQQTCLDQNGNFYPLHDFDDELVRNMIVKFVDGGIIQ